MRNAGGGQGEDAAGWPATADRASERVYVVKSLLNSDQREVSDSTYMVIIIQHHPTQIAIHYPLSRFRHHGSSTTSSNRSPRRHSAATTTTRTRQRQPKCKSDPRNRIMANGYPSSNEMLGGSSFGDECSSGELLKPVTSEDSFI